MNQKSYQAITTMLHAFPQSAADIRALLLTFDQALRGVSDQAITETAELYFSGRVPNQNTTFAPSVAEFCVEARRVDSMLPYRGRQSTPLPKPEFFREPKPEDRVRMGFKLSVLSAGVAMGKVDMVAEANDLGLDDMIALGQQWGIRIPEALWAQVKSAA